ncbi:MAG: helicase-associated domain-containing protein [Candidatus Omnitrophica bacterium]|nr:helicase-associated domain-containing protein [Candidatus Omnitrophota bacterium]MCA9435252.1 helicase-associated domain-containing protein [Candidatus Omnitrophota bacterium]
MKYLTYLMGTNVPNLKNIASRIGHFTPENSKQRLASGIIRKVTQKASLTLILDELSDQAYQLLRFLQLRPKEEWRLEDFACFREIWSEPEIFHGMNELVHSGIVGVTFESETEQEVFITFDEIDPLVCQVLELEGTDPFEPTLPASTVHSHPNVWQNDLMTFLGYCARSRFQLTKRDQIHKRDSDSLNRLLLGSRLGKLQQKFCGYEQDWASRILDQLFAIRALTQENHGLALTQDAYHLLLEQLESEHPLSGIHSAKDHHAAQGDVDLILETLDQAREKKTGWCSVEALERAVCPVIDMFEPENRPKIVRAVLFDLLLLGEIELGESDEEWLWRPLDNQSPYPEDYKEFLHIQPNFEIVAAPNLPLRTRMVLEQIAELVSIDQLYHYRIARESVYLGLCNGWTAQDQIDWYLQHSGGGRPLPQNVQHSIEDWGKSFGRLSLEHPLLLVCDTPDLAESLYHSKEIGPYCIGRYTETSLLLKKDAEEEIFEILRGMNYLPNPEVGDGTRWAIDTQPPRQG